MTALQYHRKQLERFHRGDVLNDLKSLLPYLIQTTQEKINYLEAHPEENKEEAEPWPFGDPQLVGISTERLRNELNRRENDE